MLVASLRTCLIVAPTVDGREPQNDLMKPLSGKRTYSTEKTKN
jgi:hypothetical protein